MVGRSLGGWCEGSGLMSGGRWRGVDVGREVWGVWEGREGINEVGSPEELKQESLDAINT